MIWKDCCRKPRALSEVVLDDFSFKVIGAVLKSVLKVICRKKASIFYKHAVTSLFSAFQCINREEWYCKDLRFWDQ